MSPDLFSDVIVNHQIRANVTDKNTLNWLNPDFLLKNAAFFGVGLDTGKPLIQSPSLLRGFLLDTATIYYDEFGNAFGQVSSKGAGLSVWSLATRVKRLTNVFSNVEDKKTLLLMHDPHGFFGLDHSLQETNVSNMFAMRGGRTGRVLATLAINHSKFKGWLEARLGKSSYPCLEMLERVEANGDIAAICVRLFGAERLVDKDAHEVGYFSPAQSQQRAATTIFAEINSRGPSSFHNRFALDEFDGFSWKKLYQHLVLDCQGKEDFSALRFYCAYFNAWNLGVWNILSTEMFNGNLTICSSINNVDLMGYWYDYETSVKDKPQYYANSNFLELNFPINYERLVPKGLVKEKAAKKAASPSIS